MLFKKLIRTFLKYKAQFISMAIMLVLGIGLFAGFNIEWYSVEQDLFSFFEETNLADYHIYNENAGFTIDDLNKIADIDGVTSATRFTCIETTENKDNDLVRLSISENFEVSSFTLVKGEVYDETSVDGIWISENYADKNNYKIGDTITLSYGNFPTTLTIKGICLSGEYLINRSDNALMPDYEKVGYAYTTPGFYNAFSISIFGFAYYPTINVISDLSIDEISTKIDSVLGNTFQIVPKEDISSFKEAYSEVDESKSLGLILPIIFLLIAVLTMITTMNRITTNEKIQIGILKALGFKNKKIIWHYTSYAFVLGILSSIIGLILGLGICVFIYNPAGSMGTYFEMPCWDVFIPWFVWVGIVAIIGFLTLIGYLSVKKQLKGSASEALRPYEASKMKPMLIEKTKFFHKLNFATRYNLRDSSRHIVRTLMSIFGVFGCTLLLFATFGMNSTIDNYIDMNYKTVLNYETSIGLASNVSSTRAQQLIQNYEGDYSGTIATKVNGKTYACTFCNYENDLVRIIREGEPLNDISNDGAYICERMAEEFSLEVGDKFTFALYSKKDTYKIKVVDIIQSSTEGFTLTYAAADSIGIATTIDTIYTNTSKSEIPLSNEIISLNSKEDIIKSFDSLLEMLVIEIYVLVIFSVLLAFVVLYNLGTLSYIERYRELATLKVLGFKNAKIAKILISQNVITTIIGIVLGCPFGYLALKLVMKILATNYELSTVTSWYVFVVSIALTFAVSLLVSYVTSLKAKKINMVEALKAE